MDAVDRIRSLVNPVMGPPFGGSFRALDDYAAPPEAPPRRPAARLAVRRSLVRMDMLNLGVPVADDDVVNAIVRAIQSIQRGGWNPADHPRNPAGSAGGGKFRSLTDRIADALKARKKDGTGDPLAGFDREQARKAAAKLGLKPRRGASEHEIKTMLLDHADAGHMPDAPPAKAAKKTPPANVAVLSDNELLDRFAAISQTDAPDEDALWAIDAELARRETRHRELRQALDSTSDDKMKQAFGDLSEDNPVKRRIDELVASGHDYRSAYAEAYNIDPAEMTRQELASALDVQRRPGETREQVVRRLYDEVTHLSYMRAEDWTRGNVLSRAGQAAGVSALSLFSGPRSRARKYASEELKRFWAEADARQTYTEFRAAMLGRESDKKAAATLKQAGNGKDFGL